MIAHNVVGDLFCGKAGPAGDILWSIVTKQIDATACERSIDMANVPGFQGTFTGIQRDHFGTEGEEVFTADGGDSAAAQHIAIAGGINQHTAGIECRTAFAFGDDTCADIAVHNRIGSDAIEKNVSAALF